MSADAQTSLVSPRIFQIAQAAIVVAATAVSLLGLRTVYLNDNGYSRLATVYSLVYDHTWQLDRPEGQAPNPFAEQTVDKVKVGEHFYSSKPPFMPLAMAGAYCVIETSTGLSFTRPEDLKRIVQLLTILFCIVPFSGGLVFFALTLRDHMSNQVRALWMLFALAFCTQFFGFAPQLVNHVPGAAFCIGALYFGLGIYTRKHAPTPWRFVAFGALGGLAHCFELPLTIFIALMGLALLARFPKETVVWGGLGLLPPVLTQAALLYINTGTPFPVQLRKELYLYENSPWRAPVGIDGLNEPKVIYAFHLLVGRHGVFSLFPVLLFGVASFLTAVIRPAAPMRAPILAAGLGTMILFAYYIKSTDNYGGAAYGFRWGIGAMPVLLLMAAPLVDRMRGVIPWGLLLASLAVSVYSAVECFQHPWFTDAEWTTRLIFGPTF